MLAALLATKFSRPQSRTGLVLRSRLEQLLDQAGERPLTLVCAPAGYGKTTLIASWLSRQNANSCWLSLDEGDNDPVRFWTYAIAAIQTAAPDIGDQTATLLQSPQPPTLSLALTFLINELAALTGPLFLVLDDYHFITSQPVHQSVTYLLEHLPSQIHLILTCRADPPLPLARLRVRGQLVEIREKQLRFTLEETAQFMERVIGLTLTREQLQMLSVHTEGWIASLQLAGLAALGTADSERALENFGGNHRHLADYLTEEVLSGQPESVQQFLLQTATLDRFCASLCEAILDNADWNTVTDQTSESTVQSMLEYLERANLFLIPLDNERIWYRYHHLFSELLRFRAAQMSGQVGQRQVQGRAAAWFAGHGFWQEAIHHALAAGDHEMAGRLIVQQANGVVTGGETATLQRWLAALPETQIREAPQLSLAQAWVELFSGRTEAAEQWLQIGTENIQLEQTESRELLAQALAVRATLAFARQKVEEIISDSEQALALLPEAERSMRALLSWHLAFTYRSIGETKRSLDIYHQVIEMSRDSGNFLINLSARRELADFLIGQGHLSKAKSLLEQLLEEAAANDWMHLVAAAGAHIHLSELYYEWNALETAADHLLTAISMPQASDMSFDAYGQALLARALAAQGNLPAALEVVHMAEQTVLQASHPQRRILTLAHITRFWLDQGDVARAGAWLPDDRDILQDPRNEVYARQQLSHARYLLALHKKSEAGAVVSTLLPPAQTSGRVRDVVALHLLQAQLCEEAESTPAIRQALLLAEPVGLLRTFLDGGQPVAALLDRLRGEADVPTATLNRILAAFPLSAMSKANRLLLEPLSQRELEVLRLMAEGYSNREIADKLVFTVATAKKHAEHIYGKLGVNSRTQAIAVARELALL